MRFSASLSNWEGSAIALSFLAGAALGGLSVSACPSFWTGATFALPFLIGVASGGQGIYAKLGADWLQVLKTTSGWLYWLSRGAVPAFCYYVYFETRLNQRHSVSAAILCGLGSEVVLRSRLFIRSKASGYKKEDVYKGVFDLVEWYQNLLLRKASDQLAAERNEFMRKEVGNVTDFPALCSKARSNAAGFSVSGQELKNVIAKKKAAFDKEPAVKDGSATEDLHRDYAYELGYALLGIVGRKSLQILLN